MKLYDHFYADGGFHPSTGEKPFALISPHTEQQIGVVLCCSIVDLEDAIRSARNALPIWSASSVDDRKQLLRKLHGALESRAAAITQTLALEIGCPVWLGNLMQVPMGLKGIELAIDGIDQIVWTENVGNAVVERVPAGVVAALTPWNFPIHQIVAKVAAAIAAGCTVVLKPSEVAPGAALLFMEAIHECGFPAGVVNLVWGDGELGNALVTSNDIDKVSFTGSTNVGRQIMTSSAASLTPVALELGGKSAVVILDDADLDVAIPTAARLILANSGQACVSQSRMIVPARLVPEIIDRFKTAAEMWPMGDPIDPSTRLGPVATLKQFEHIKRMATHAASQGATLCTGTLYDRFAAAGGGFYVKPTLFADVKPAMEIAQEEVFGPVLALLAYRDEAEAQILANATRYGLSGAVWAGNPERATAFAKQMRTGQVVINGAAQNLATPFGGFGASGFGRENGRFGIEELLTYRSLHGASH